MASIPEGDPTGLTIGIIAALGDSPDEGELVRLVVTPESLASWGDFSDVAHALKEVNGNVTGTPRQFPGVTDVALVYLLTRDSPFGHIAKPQPVEIAFVFTWIWRPELGGWRLHHFGRSPLNLSLLPRSSPGDGPPLHSVPV